MGLSQSFVGIFGATRVLSVFSAAFFVCLSFSLLPDGKLFEGDQNIFPVSLYVPEHSESSRGLIVSGQIRNVFLI